MDLSLVIKELFPNENVSPDMSSYSAMIAHWRGSKAPPTQQEVNDKWVEIQPKLVNEQLSVSVAAKVEAMWAKLAYAQDTKINEIKVAEAAVTPI